MKILSLFLSLTLILELKSLGYIITDEPLDEKFTNLADEKTSSSDSE